MTNEETGLSNIQVLSVGMKICWRLGADSLGTTCIPTNNITLLFVPWGPPFSAFLYIV